MDRRTLTMNWDRMGDDDDDAFFESRDRISSVAPLDLASSDSDDDDEFEDSRRSFVSSVSSKSLIASINSVRKVEAVGHGPPVLEDYSMWMSEPGDVKERRKRLLQGMGLSSNKNLLKIASAKIVRAVSRKPDNIPLPVQAPAPASTATTSSHQPSAPADDVRDVKEDEAPKQEATDSGPILLVRSRSDGDIETLSARTKSRKEELIGPVSKQRLTRTSSVIITSQSGLFPYLTHIKASPQKMITCKTPNSGMLTSMFPEGGLGSFFLIKNLDTGKEFIVKEYNEQGMWNKLSDVQTGKQLTMEEFEKSVGYSPVVKELMRRQNVRDDKKLNALSKSFRYSKRRGVSLLKNIKGVANSMSGRMTEKEIRERIPPIPEHKTAKDSSQWVKVRQNGKSNKEFSALHLCQEIQAHEGAIWAIRFSTDARYLASAGQDRVIRIWDVQDCEVMSVKPPDDVNSVSTPVHPMSASDKPPLAETNPMPSEKRKKGNQKGKKKSDGIPDYARVPETVFAVAEKPLCTLTGHQDEVMDLKWSTDQQLLSASIDKTVRLWDMETKSCLKTFPHNDFVTCIDFNPVDESCFMSGSLDSKIRIWSIPNRCVVNWIDVHEMITAACFTPDGQGAMIGTHEGVCRSYSYDDCKLEQKDVIEFQDKKKGESKKITGLQFAPSSSELLVTSADCRVRILDGSDVTHRFKGLKNSNNQIAASFSREGKYIISASEDDQVYIWKHEGSGGKGKATVLIQSHEHFPCKDVLVAILWPGSLKQEAPAAAGMQSKRHSRRISNVLSEAPLTQGDANSRKKDLPPLPGKKAHRAADSISSNPDEDTSANCSSELVDPGVGSPGESFGSGSQSIKFGDWPSISASSSSSNSQPEGGASNGAQSRAQETAWGSVIVATTNNGDIRVYQNFGLPVKGR